LETLILKVVQCASWNDLGTQSHRAKIVQDYAEMRQQVDRCR